MWACLSVRSLEARDSNRGYSIHPVQEVLASVFSQRFENLPNPEDEWARGTRRGSHRGRVQISFECSQLMVACALLLFCC